MRAVIRPGRSIVGIAALLLPYRDGAIDWEGFRGLLTRTVDAGLLPAVNMDTGYVDLIDEDERAAVLEVTRTTVGGQRFVAGAFVADTPGDALDVAGYRRAIAAVTESGGTPVVFQSHGLTSTSDEELVAAYDLITRDCDEFIAFELGPMFAPFGRIYDLDTYQGLVGMARCTGAKHSSLSREAEWDRLALRDRLRPGFNVYTGNDLAIDMVMWGSDYLLGLASFAPDAFAARDAAWASGDLSFHERNDALQALGSFAFRSPVPAYKHDAAMALALRGWIGSDEAHPAGPRRPATDRAVLAALLERVHV